MSKDFCASGLRMGCLYTANAAINTAMGNLGYFTGCGGPLQHQVAEMLEDKEWTSMFLR